jgi:hypothetical protein
VLRGTGITGRLLRGKGYAAIPMGRSAGSSAVTDTATLLVSFRKPPSKPMGLAERSRPSPSRRGGETKAGNISGPVSLDTELTNDGGDQGGRYGKKARKADDSAGGGRSCCLSMATLRGIHVRGRSVGSGHSREAESPRHAPRSSLVTGRSFPPPEVRGDEEFK